ncbi:hypothetical protein ACQR3P_29540 [Rhodococcus sp. IEGM1300]
MGVLDKLKPYVDDALNAAPFYEGIKQGQIPSELQLSNFGFGKGDRLYNPKVMGGYDNAVRIDADGKVIQDENIAFNSRTVLIFDGFEEVLDKDGKKGVSAIFHDELDPNNRGAFYQFGDDAVADLQEKLSKLVPVQFMDERTQGMIENTRLEDLARRRYEGIFGLTNRGKVNESGIQTRGYQAAKRMYMNTEAFVQLIQEGLTEDEAMERLNFNSQWDASTKQFVYNSSEARDFQTLLPRMRSEVGTVKAIVNEIETAFQEALLSAETEPQKMAVRQQMEEAFLRATDQALPKNTVSKAPLLGQERFTFYNPLTESDSSISVSSPDDFQKNLDRLTRVNDQERKRLAGVTNLEGEALKEYVKQEERALQRQRQTILTRALVSQGIIEGGQDEIEEALSAYHDPYNQRRRLAELIQPNARHDMIETRSIQPDSMNVMNPDMARLIARDSIERVKKVNSGVQVVTSEVEGQKVRYSGDFNELLDRIDSKQGQAPGSNFDWSPNHRKALEKILVGLDESKLQYSVLLDETSNSLKIVTYTSDQADQARAQLAKNAIPDWAGTVTMPIIEDGKFKAGRRELNARPSLMFADGEMVVKGPIDEISERMMGDLKRFASAVHDGDGDRATQIMKSSLDNAVNGYAGSQGILSFNDGLEVNNTLADKNKQFSIDTSDYVLKKMIADGELTERDFYKGTVLYDENGKITKEALSMDKVSSGSMQRVYEAATGILNEAGVDAYYGGVKSDHAGRLILGQQDVRAYMPGGWLMNPGRDNPIQWLNVFEMEGKTLDEMGRQIEGAGGYFNKEPLLVTDKGEQFMSSHWAEGKQSTFSVKAVHMDGAQIRNKMEQMAGDTEYQGRMVDEGYLVKPNEMITDEAKRFNVDGEDYVLNPLRHPSTYENSGIMADDISASRDRYKRLLDGHFEMDSSIEDGGSINPGQRIGRQMGDDGRYHEVFWEGKEQGRLRVGDAEVGVDFQHQAFKWMADTEKFTEQKHSRWLVSALAGDEEVSLIFNPDIVKHKDWGIWVNGRMRMIADEMRNTSDSWDEETKLRVESKLSQAGYQWDDSSKRLYDTRDELTGFNPKNVDALLGDAAFSSIDRSGKETFIVDMAASDVGDYSKMVGQEGRQVIGRDADGEDILGRMDGVRLGWRELNVLQEQGLGSNREALMDEMIQGAIDEKDGPVRTSALQRAQNTRAVFDATLRGIDAKTSQIRDFNDLPLDNHVEDSYKGTIFDIEGKGVYLELPTVQGIDGKDINYTYEAGTARESVRQGLEGNRLFIPNVGLDGLKGERYLDGLNGQIANIYKKAKSVETATGPQSKLDAQKDLQGAIDGYFKRVTHDLTSSKGHFAQNVSTAKVSGVSGLLKMVDPVAAAEINGDYEFLTDNQAKAMGVFDKLQSGEDVFGQSVRYPSFHGDSMVAVKYALGGTDDRFLLGTAYTGFLQRGDQDGDMKHNILISQSEEAQAELRNRWETQRGAENARYESFMNKVNSQTPGFDWRTAVGGDKEFAAMGANTSEEISAKIGKRLVGMTSNMNLQLRQLADQAFDAGSDQHQMMYTLGESIEQKLISSKHGLSSVDGKLPALAFMDLIKQNTVESHQRALDVANEFIGEDFVERTNLSSALDATRQAVGIAEVNLRNPAFQIGSSGGITADVSMSEIDEILSANPGGNSLHQQMHKAMGEANELYGTIGEAHTTSQWDDTFAEDQRRHRQTEGGSVDTGPSKGPYDDGPPPSNPPDIPQSGPPEPPGGGTSGGGPPPDVPNWQNNLDDMVNHVKRNKRAYLLGGAAVGAMSMYNMLNDGPSGFNSPPPKTSGGTLASQYETSRGYQVIAQARGKMPTERIQGQVSAWTGQSGGNLNIEKKDNTKKLNPMFYRDQVEGYI